MRKINEIFYSLQGEGFYTGAPAVFIRFSGCNLKCSFCDTDHRSFVEMSDGDILNEVKKYPCNRLVLTGGEPALSIDEAFISMLHREGKFVSIETNGTIALPDGIDWITCSPKANAPVVLAHIDELKVVYQGQSLDQYASISCPHRFLQPCSNKNIPETVACILRNPLWRLSLQTHKFIHIR